MSNPIAGKAIEDFEDLRATRSARASAPSSSSSCTTTTTNNQLRTDVNHLTRGNGRGEEEEEEEEEGNESAIDTSHMKQEKEEEQLQRGNIIDINRPETIDTEQTQQQQDLTMSTDDESDGDAELLNTLAQLHGIVHSAHMTHHVNQQECRDPYGREREVVDKKSMNAAHTDDRRDEESISGSISSTSSSSSSSSSLLRPTNECSDTALVSHRSMIDDGQIILEKSQPRLVDLREPTLLHPLDPLTRPTTGVMDESKSNYLWNQSITPIRSVNNAEKVNNDPLFHQDERKSSMATVRSVENRQQSIQDVHRNDSSSAQLKSMEHQPSSSFHRDITTIVERLLSDTFQCALVEVQQCTQQIEQLVDRMVSEAIDQVYRKDRGPSNAQGQMFTKAPFYAPSDDRCENPTDPWATQTILPSHLVEPMAASTTESNQEPPVPTAVFRPLSMRRRRLCRRPDSALVDNDLTKSTLTATVKNNSLDDSFCFTHAALCQVIHSVANIVSLSHTSPSSVEVRG